MQNTPRPFSFASSQTWSGNDGSWSTFVMRIGTPEQNFHVLPSTSGHETFIPFPEGCLSTDPENCGILRGTFPESQKQGFAYNESKTWSLIGIYSTDLREDLGYEANGMYGRETVGLQVQNSGGVTLEKQIVGGLASKDFFLGMFGLGIKPSNFTDFNYPQSSFISNLKDQNIIPSLSFAYNAGASYRMPKVPASLTLGGYDSTKFQSTIDSHALSFDPNDERSLSIGVQKVTAIKTLHGTVTLTDKAIYSLIDSTVPYLWLPRTVCDSFELSFGLTYDSTTELYLVNNTIRERLQELNPTITFSLGGTNDPSRLVNIELPYAAFDLQASWPIYPNTTNYFPIKRATNESQYTLGRAFLQEAYIIADYERSNFSIYQAVLDISKKPNIVPIISSTSVDGTREKNGMIESTNKNKLSRGAIAGISVGSILFAAAILYLMFFLWRRRQS
ncbi:aspartic peptidase domain-containing protein, partial [Dendryphion nanum]